MGRDAAVDKCSLAEKGGAFRAEGKGSVLRESLGLGK